MKRKMKYSSIFIFIFIVLTTIITSVHATQIPIPNVGIDIGMAQNPEEVSSSISILILLTILSIAPAILVMMTSFTRIIIILSFLRSALGTQQMPPNQVLVGLALFLTFFIMSPVISNINTNAYEPYKNGEIAQDIALEKASLEIKTFMLKQTTKKDLALFINISGNEKPKSQEELKELPLTSVIPAFMISELTIAFKIGFLLYLPFLIIDMVVASTLMSMGMMMLPPVMISLPFKVLLFILVGGWNLVIQTILSGFN